MFWTIDDKNSHWWMVSHAPRIIAPISLDTETEMEPIRHDAMSGTVPTSGMPERPRLLRLHDVCRTTGLCRSMIYRLEAENKFPGRVKIGSRAVGWVESEIAQWVADRIASSRMPG
jgi:prophage regulatory protein